jgi:protein gp37
VTQNQEVNWSCDILLEPFSWRDPKIVRVQPDLFEPEIRNAWRDKVFAAMALCPEHRFWLRTAYPQLYSHIEQIAHDRLEWLAWRVSVSKVPRELGRQQEATGDGPAWPLANVDVE